MEEISTKEKPQATLYKGLTKDMEIEKLIFVMEDIRKFNITLDIVGWPYRKK